MPRSRRSHAAPPAAPPANPQRFSVADMAAAIAAADADRVAASHDAFVLGFVRALVETSQWSRGFLFHPHTLPAVCAAAGISIATARAAGCPEPDLALLARAGVPERYEPNSEPIPPTSG